MATAKDFSEKVQLLAFILQEGSSWDTEWGRVLEERIAPVLHRGKWFPFDRTPYYKPEMGEGLFRSVISFERWISPETIAEEKKKANELEALYALGGNRRVNIDIGYMDLDKVVLPSYKRGPFKIYGGDGIWLDMLLNYAKGHFLPTAWAFEDFKRNPYEHDLLLIREKFKKRMKTGREPV